MCPCHDDVVVVRAGALRDDVDLRSGLDEDAHGRSRAGLRERRPVRKARPHDRNRDGGTVRQQRPHDQRLACRRVPLVEDHDRGGAGGLSVGCLDPERTRAALDQRDVPGREAGEVARLAAARHRIPRWREHEIDRGHRGRDIAFATSGERTGRVRPRGRSSLPQQGTGELEGELVERDLVARVLEQALHVLDALRVPVRSRGPAAGREGIVVGVRDGLQRLLVGTDAVDRHALQQGLIRRVRATGTAGWRGRGRRWQPDCENRRERCEQRERQEPCPSSGHEIPPPEVRTTTVPYPAAVDRNPLS